jgi:hypothetical protein
MPAPNRIVIGVVLALLGLYQFVYIVLWLRGEQQPPFGDFFALWSFGKFVWVAGPAIYDSTALQTFQHQLDPAFDGLYQCAYPPIFLLVLLPFGWLPLAPAYVVWIGVTLGLYVVATLGRRVWSPWTVALLVAPTTLLTVIYGQNGFLSAALLVGGLRALKRAPIGGGMLLAGLAYKPQFAVLLPVVLLAGRDGRAMLAGATALLLATLASIAVFGGTIWLAWWHAMLGYQAHVPEQIALSHTMPTLAAGLRTLGAPESIASGTQLLLALGVAVVIWRAVARRLDERTIAACIVAVVLVTPYAFTYDMPMVTAAMAIEARRRQRLGISTQRWETCVVALFYTSLLAMGQTTLPLVAVALLGIMFVRLMRDDGR